MPGLAYRLSNIIETADPLWEGKVTVWKASRVAGVPLLEMVEIAASKKIPVQYREEDFEAVFGVKV